MPNDSTQDKIQQLGRRFSPPERREEQIVRSRKKLVAASKAESIADQFIAENQNFDRKLLAGLLGGTGDLVQLGADALTSALVSQPVEVPYTTEYFKERFGVDNDDDLSAEIIGGLLSPDPLSTAAAGGKAIAVGAVAAKKQGGQLLKRLDDFLEMGTKKPYDADSFQQTGWYNGLDGKPRFWLSDAESKINKDAVYNHPKFLSIKESIQQGHNAGADVADVLNFKLEELLQHDELYELYPQLRNLQVKFHILATDDGRLLLRNPRTRKGDKGGLASSRGLVHYLQTNNLQGVDDLHSTVLHEVQHAVQMFEGFAKGGGSQLTDEMIDSYENVVRADAIVKAIDNGADDIDSLGFELEQMGFDAKTVDAMLAREDTNYYLAADEIERQDLARGVKDLRVMLEDEMTHVIDYLAVNKNEEALGYFLNDMNESLLFEDIQQVGYRAYKNLHGEAEARLVEMLKDHTQEQIAKRQGPPNPLQAKDVDPTRPLSLGTEREIPGRTQVLEN